MPVEGPAPRVTHRRLERRSELTVTDVSQLAATPGMTSIALMVALTTPDAGIPMYMLTAEQREDVIAYILGLRQPISSRPPVRDAGHCRRLNAEWREVCAENPIRYYKDRRIGLPQVGPSGFLTGRHGRRGAAR